MSYLEMSVCLEIVLYNIHSKMTYIRDALFLSELLVLTTLEQSNDPLNTNMIFK